MQCPFWGEMFWEQDLRMILANLVQGFWLNYSEVSLKKSENIVTVHFFFITETSSELFYKKGVLHLWLRSLKYTCKEVHFLVKLQARDMYNPQQECYKVFDN